MIKAKDRESKMAAQDFIDELRAGAAEDTAGVQKLQSAILDATKDMPQLHQSFDNSTPKTKRLWLSPKLIFSGVSLASALALTMLITPLSPEPSTPSTTYLVESELVFAELVLSEDEFLFSEEL